MMNRTLTSKTWRRSVPLTALIASCLFADGPAVFFEGAQVTFDEACLLETLQGLVNRQGPRLLVNFPAWDSMGHDRQWRDIYGQYHGVTFRDDIRFMDRLLVNFSDAFEGFVVFDPVVDATRYMAITLSGTENLLPVSPGLFNGYSAQFQSETIWTGVDFSSMTREAVASAWNAGYRMTEWEQHTELMPGEGLWIHNTLSIGNELTDGTAEGKGILSYGPVLLDLSIAPFLRAQVSSLENGASFYVQLVTGNQVYTSPMAEHAGVLDWDVASSTGLSCTVLFDKIRLVTAGHGGSALWHSVGVVDGAGGRLPASKPSKNMTEMFGKPVVYDFRGRFEDSIEAYEWALEKILPGCNRGYAHAVGGVVDGSIMGSGPWMSLDFAVMKKGFVFNLSFNKEGEVMAFGRSYSSDKGQARLYRKILTALESPALITGYGDNENDWFPLINEYGHAFLVPQYRNTSFHAAVPATGQLQQHRRHEPEEVDAGNKYYVCFVLSDGDTLKGPATQIYQSWNTDPRRGDVPVTFAVPNWMGTYFPAMLEYYYATATPNDHFSGSGVWMLNTVDSLRKERLYARIREGMAAADFDTLINVTIEPVADAEFRKLAAATDALGIAQIIWSGSPWGAQEKFDNGTVFVTNPEWLGYCHRATDHGRWEAPLLHTIYHDRERWDHAKHAIVRHIEQVAAMQDPPFIILVFPSVHHGDMQYSILADIADALNKELFSVVRFDEACAAIRKYYEGYAPQ